MLWGCWEPPWAGKKWGRDNKHGNAPEMGSAASHLRETSPPQASLFPEPSLEPIEDLPLLIHPSAAHLAEEPNRARLLSRQVLRALITG